MFFKTIFYLLLCHQSICYIPPALCSNLSFGKCSNGDFCGITDTGDYACLPCPANSVCPGDGYIYSNGQLNQNAIRLPKSNGSYIVNGRSLKRFRKIGKIIRVGLKVAAIAKTGGVAGLKKAAAAKAKQMAIRKGIQCLKNGLSNFCNGKKKTASKVLKIKPRAGSALKEKIGSINKKQVSVVKPKPQIKPVVSMAKTKPSVSSVKPKPTITRRGTKPSVPSVKTKSKPTVARRGSKPKPSTSPAQPCSNIFDNLANKVNNVTRHVAVKVVNKGRDWIKQRINGNTGNCGSPTNGVKRPTNLRGSPKTKPTRGKMKPSIKRPPSGSTDDTPSNSGSDDASSSVTSAPQPNTRVRPIIKTDDGVPNRRPVQPRRKPAPTIQRTDDGISVATRRPIRKPLSMKTPAPTIQQSDDGTSVPTRRPVKKTRTRRSPLPTFQQSDDNVIPTRRPIRTNRPSRKPLPLKTPSPTIQQSDDGTSIPTRMPVRTRKRRVRMPQPLPKTIQPTAALNTKLPISNPTRRPTVIKSRVPTIIQSRIPTRLPTRIPTRLPTIIPTRLPTIIPTRLPTRGPTPVPTRSPTRIPTMLPTRRPTPLPTRLPTLTPISSPSMIPISWAMFSSAPIAPSNIPPTHFPTLSMFKLITFFPTAQPTPRNSPSPSSLRTSVISQSAVTLTPTVQPTTRSPTIGPTVSPTLSPTVLPSLAPIAITNSPTTPGVGASALNSGSSSSSQSAVSSSTIGAAVGCIIIFLIFIAACVFVINKKSKDKTPFQKWTDHYSVKRPTQVIDEDIHHFYNKGPRPSTPRLSINANTPFTPHLSNKTAFRNSQMGGQLGSQRNSLSPGKKLQVHNKL